MLLSWIVEVRTRDLESRLWAASQLAKLGYTSLIGRRSSVSTLLEQLQVPSLLVEKSLNGEHSPLDAKIAEMGGQVAVLDEEGGIYCGGESYDRVIRSRFPEGWAKHYHSFWVWGRRQLESMRKLPLDRLSLTGNPRFDMCKPEFAPFHQVLSPNLKKLMPYVLINTNFNFCNNVLKHNNFRDRCVNSIESGVWGITLEEVDSRIAFEQQSLNSYLNLARTLAKRFPRIHFILRPHPGEDPSVYRTLAREYTNLALDRGEPIGRMISSCAGVIHHDCTTALEALIGNIQPISYAPDGYREYSQEMPVQLSVQAKTEADVVSALESTLSKTASRNLGDLENLICNAAMSNRSTPAIEDAVRTVADKPLEVSLPRLLDLSRKGQNRSAWVGLKVKARLLIDSKSRQTHRVAQSKFRPLDLADAERFQSAIATMDPKANSTITRLDSYTLAITPSA